MWPAQLLRGEPNPGQTQKKLGEPEGTTWGTVPPAQSGARGHGGLLGRSVGLFLRCPREFWFWFCFLKKRKKRKRKKKRAEEPSSFGLRLQGSYPTSSLSA